VKKRKRSDSIKDALTEVALATARATIAAIKRGRLTKEDREYIVTKGTLLDSGGLYFTQQKLIRKTWAAYAANKIIEAIRRRHGTKLESCAQQLTTDEKDTPTIRGDLGYFLLAVIERAADGASPASIQEMVNRLLFELSGGDLHWVGEVWLRGIRVTETLQVMPGFTIRPPKSEDFCSELPSSAIGLGRDLLSQSPDSVLVLTCAARSRPDFRREINALCLFRLGAVEVLRERWKSDSVFPYMGSSGEPFLHNRSPAFTYELAAHDAPSLAEFLRSTAVKLPVKPLGHHEDPRWIGLKNYFRALLTASDPEERLAQAVASLEASLLSDDVKEGVTFGLSLRTASLLWLAGLNPLEIFSQVRTAYGFRSKYSHGGSIKAKDLEKVRDLCQPMMELCRLAVVKFIEIPNAEHKREILTKLDLSLLDKQERQSLGDRLKGGLWNYVIDRSA